MILKLLLCYIFHYIRNVSMYQMEYKKENCLAILIVMYSICYYAIFFLFSFTSSTGEYDTICNKNALLLDAIASFFFGYFLLIWHSYWRCEITKRNVKVWV